ncbi:diacylglycerol O-acyltransferase 3-1-like [Curcuma longa]|uniref:diacylglycerol O-acyltransferase 3-1-like n=1 Tax=Curcuma longa TaxID=136217 RepID=UPI003D9EF080
MEFSGVVPRRTAAVSGVLPIRVSVTGSIPTAAPSRARFARRVSASGRSMGLSASFSDVGHLEYYASPVRCGGGKCKKEEKKKAKLVKGLSKDLAALCSMGIGGVDASQGLAAEAEGKMITEAAELLMAELKQLRAQEKEMKRKRKEEKAATKAAMKKGCNESSTSSSSSESSDSECDGEVVTMNNHQASIIVQEPESKSLPIAPAAQPKPVEETEHHNAQKPPQDRSNYSVATIGSCSSSKRTAPATEMPANKVEVCIGGKCKRSGALELMEEFNKKIGSEGAVVGCKCMGKCKEGPNVRVVNHPDEAIAPRNPLCLGVGLEDVGTIVAKFFVEKKAQVRWHPRSLEWHHCKL